MIEPTTRKIFLQDGISNESLKEIVAAIVLFNEEDNAMSRNRQHYVRKPIHIYINSFGGSLYDMWSLIGVMDVSKTPIYTYCTGYAMSAGFMIFIAGHKRFIGQHAKLMYHQLSSGVIGTAQEIAEYHETAEQEYKHMTEYVIQHTKINEQKLQEVKECKQDWYIDADTAITLGIADEVIKQV